jgi:hypothetical protein
MKHRYRLQDAAADARVRFAFVQVDQYIGFSVHRINFTMERFSSFDLLFA